MVLVPSRALSVSGDRIGRGKGYYDRFLSDLRACNSRVSVIGVGFSFQYFDRLPVDAHDQPLDRVIVKGSPQRLDQIALD